MLNFIFFFTMYPVLFILYYIGKNEGKVKRHCLFGIRISDEWLTEEESETLQTEYRRKVNRYLLILASIPVVTPFIPYFSICLTIWMIWLMATIVLIMLPYALGNRKLLQLKQERQVTKDADNIIYAEIRNAGSIRTVKKTDFILPNLLSMGIAILAFICLHDERFELYSILIVTFAACTPLFYVCAILLDRMKTKVISTNSDINVNYARATKKQWKNFWRICIWINTLFTAALLLLVLFTNFSEGFATHIILWGSILYCILIMIACGYLWKKKLQLDNQYIDKMDMPDTDDERAWIGGILYYNPKDSRTMVSKKFGIGTTTNMATPAGKATTLFTIVSLLIIPISCVWVMLEEFTPLSLSIDNNVLTATHWKTEYEIPLNTITEVTLLEELPRSSKINGTGMDALEKGTFRNSVDGKYQSFLNPQNGVFIRFTANDTIYYMSAYNDDETLRIYEFIH